MDAVLKRARGLIAGVPRFAVLTAWLLAIQGWASAPPQQVSGANSGGCASPGISATLTSTPANSLIVVGIQWNTTTRTMSVADSGSDTYIGFPGSPVCNGTTECGQGFYTFNAAGGVTSVTVTASGASACNFTVAVYTGMASTGTLDQSASATGTGTALDSGLAATTTNANDTLIGLGMVQTTNTTFTAGTVSCTYTMERQQPAAPSAKSSLEDCNVSATGTYKAQMTVGTSQAWVAIIGAFKQLGGAPPPPHELLLMGVGEQAALDLTNLLAFPSCDDPAGNPIPGCTNYEQVCGTWNGQLACLDLFVGQNVLAIFAIQNNNGKVTRWPAGTLALAVQPVSLVTQ